MRINKKHRKAILIKLDKAINSIYDKRDEIALYQIKQISLYIERKDDIFLKDIINTKIKKNRNILKRIKEFINNMTWNSWNFYNGGEEW